MRFHQNRPIESKQSATPARRPRVARSHRAERVDPVTLVAPQAGAPPQTTKAEMAVDS